MINITKKFRKALFNDQRNYKELVTILLSDGTRLELTNENLLEGVGFDDMVSEDNNFQIGAAIINSASVKINNMYDDYTDYNFDYAKVYANVGLDFSDGTSEVIRKFTAYVDEAKYNGSAIELSCMDYMGLFDRVYDGNLGFPNTTLGIIQYCCTRCGITLGTPSFPRDDVQVAEHPDFGENCTYRQIISWVAQQSCCFARCNTFGELEIKWYDMDSLNEEANRLDGGQFDKGTPKYQTGDHADGGGFMTDGDEYDVEEFSAASLPVHVLNGIFSCEVCKDPVTITGISVTSTEYDETTGTGSEATTERKTYTVMVGTDGYVLSISGNPLISTPAMATEVANFIASNLVGFTFWIGHVSHLSDPSIEAGDVMLFSDFKGVTYRGVVSSTSFKCGESQTTDSSAETPNQNTKKQRSGADATTQAIMDLGNWLLRQKSAYEQGIDTLSSLLDAKAGLYTTKEATGSGDIWYLHDKPALNESTKVIKVTADAIGFSTDGGQTWNSGLTIDGQMIATKLSAQGVDAGWVRTGILMDKTGANAWDLDKGEIKISSSSKVGNETLNTKFTNIDNAISLRATKTYVDNAIESAITVDPDSIRMKTTTLLWDSTHSKMENDGTITTIDTASTYKTKLQSGSLTFQYGSNDVGKLGSQYWAPDKRHNYNTYGLSMSLDYLSRGYMSFATQDKQGGSYKAKLLYAKSNLYDSDTDTMSITKDTWHSWAAWDFHDYSLKNIVGAYVNYLYSNDSTSSSIDMRDTTSGGHNITIKSSTIDLDGTARANGEKIATYPSGYHGCNAGERVVLQAENGGTYTCYLTKGLLLAAN